MMDLADPYRFVCCGRGGKAGRGTKQLCPNAVPPIEKEIPNMIGISV
jgi:hypothetical protein